MKNIDLFLNRSDIVKIDLKIHAFVLHNQKRIYGIFFNKKARKQGQIFNSREAA